MQLCRLVALSFALLQGSTVHVSASNYTMVMVELDPDASSVTGICSAAFAASLTAHVSTWFVEAVASGVGSYPPVTNASSVLNLNYFNGGRWHGHRAMKEDESTTDVQSAQQGARKLCTKDVQTCTCCGTNCGSWCGSGCTLCSGSRNLRSGSSRQLGGNNWMWGDYNVQSSASGFIQFAAQRWLWANDFTRCMGNPWLLSVSVTYY